jgi:AI-2 transport protein TqsA
MTQFQARILTVLLSIVVIVLLGAALRATYFVTMPLFAAFFVTVLVWPVHVGIRQRLPRRIKWLSIVLTLLMILAVLGAFIGGAWYAVYYVASERFQEYMQQLQAQWQQITAWLEARNLPVPGEGEENTQLASRLLAWGGTAAISITGILSAIVLIILFVALMLVEAHHWRDKSETALSDERARAVIDAVAATTKQVRTFILVQAFISASAATVTTIFLWIVGMPFALIWGLLTFLLDFVPNVGPVIAGTLVALGALVMLGWGPAIIVAIGVFIIQQLFGNYLDPLLKGRRMAISPLIVLFSVVFWSWIWGPAGAVVAVPMTATIIIACAHVPSLRPIALMLSRTADEQKLIEQTHDDPDGAVESDDRKSEPDVV